MDRVAPPGGVVPPAMTGQPPPFRRPWTGRPGGEFSASESAAVVRRPADASVRWSRSISSGHNVTELTRDENPGIAQVEIKNAATMNAPANAARAAVRSDASRRARSEQATAIRWKVERLLTGWTGLPDGLLRSSCSSCLGSQGPALAQPSQPAEGMLRFRRPGPGQSPSPQDPFRF